MSGDSALASSYEFHRGLESFGGFIRREKKTLALCCGTLVAILLAILFSVDASYFYPRIETDQLLYLLKAKSLVETGSTAARSAVNSNPFPYSAMPGVLRAPFLMMFSDFDAQLRAIQLLNVIIVALTGTMAAYILSWSLPQRLHPLGIAFAFGFLLLSPDWLTNTFVPLADAPYAALTLACVIIAAALARSDAPLRRHGAAILLFAVLFGVASLIRFTAPALLVYAALLLWPRFFKTRIPLRTLAPVAAVAVAMLAGLVFVNSDAIFGRYLKETLFFINHSGKVAMGLNIFASAFPAQIIPVFNLGFQVAPHGGRPGFPVFATTPRDMVLCFAGMFISFVILRGMVLERRRFLPELGYLIVVLPVLALLEPSTTRYLMSYQPIIWICFFAGFASITVRLRSRLPARQLRTIGVAVIAAVAIGVVSVRYARTARNAGSRSPAGAVTQSFVNARNTERTFRNLRSFLESRPREKTLLIGGRGNIGLFTVIANRDYYRPDSNLVKVAQRKDVLAVLACGTVTACGQFDQWIRAQDHWMNRFGTWRFNTVYKDSTASSRALVRKVVPAEPSDSVLVQSALGRTER